MEPAATDSELVQQTQKGNPQAFTTLVERHFGMVYAVAYAQTGHHETAEDLAQEVFLRAYLYLASLENPARFPQWLVRITHNLAKNWHRGNARAARLVTMVPIDDADEEAAMAEESRAGEAMASDENAAWLNEAILKLPEEQREAVLLHYTEGLSRKEIADRLAVHPSTIGRHLKQALKALQHSLEPLLKASAPSLKPRKSTVARTVAVLGAAAAMSTTSKSALAAVAGGSAWISSVSLGISGLSWTGAAFNITPVAFKILLSPLLNVLILVYGGMANIAHTRSFRERRFMTWMTWGFVLLALCFLLGLHNLVDYIAEGKMSPESSRWVLAAFSVIIVAVLLIVAIFANRRQQKMQHEDQDLVGNDSKDRMKPRYLMITAASYIFGGMGWLVLLSWIFRDGILLWITPIAAAVLLAYALYRVNGTPQIYQRVMIQTIILMLVYALATFNWHWNSWKTILVQRAGMEYAFTIYGRLGWNTIIIALYLFLWQRLHWSCKPTDRIDEKP